MVKKKQAYVAELSTVFLRDIRHGWAASRLELASRHKLAPSTVGIHIDRLITSGHLSQDLFVSGNHRGRPIQRLSLRGEVGIFIGIEFEARTMHAVCTDFSGKVLGREFVAIPSGADAAAVLALVDGVIAALRDAHPAKLLGIGVGSPGVIDPDQGIARHYRFIKGWTDVPVVSHLQSKFATPVVMETNVRATALGIQLYEKSFETDDFVCFLIRSGVGAGSIRQSTLFRGHTYTAGEIGRVPYPGSEPVLTVEDLTSLPAILRFVEENLYDFAHSDLHGSELSSARLIAAAQKGDALARQAIVRAIRHLGWACHIIALVDNPRTIVIAGPLAELGEWLRLELQAALSEQAARSNIQIPQVAVTTLGATVGALGAASLAIETWKL
jgi:glucokinase